MGRPFSQDYIETVRQAADIVQIISDYVPLKKAGTRLKGLCPFHQEKTPSFSVDPGNQLFYCFGCQTGGDVFKFVMLYDKLGFGEAVESLAGRFGVPLPKVSGPAETEHQRLLEMNGAADEWFRKMLADSEGGRRCRAYLEERGLSEETIRRLRLGYAPDTWEGLRSHLLAKRFKPEQLMRGGLTLQRKSGQGEYDRFRDRLIFPIHDAGGRTIAFGGRALGDVQPKYINSPETPTYTKGNHLYGFDLSREAIRREGFAIVVEGYMDLAAVVQAGFDNVVASLGTAFTPPQAQLLARAGERVVVSYDGDSAGATATARSLDLLLQRGFDVRVVDLPAGKDPDDVIRSEGADAYGKLVRGAPEYLQFLLQREIRSRDVQRIEGKVGAVNAMLPHLARLDSAIERAAWAGRLADELQIEEGLVLQELRGALRKAATSIRQRPPEPRRAPAQAERRLVSLLLNSEEERRRWVNELDVSILEGTPVCTIVETILRLTRENKRVDHPAVLAELEERPADCELLTRMAFDDEPETGPGIEDCLCAFEREKLQRLGVHAVREIGKLQVGEVGEDLPEKKEDINERLLRMQQIARQRDALYDA